MPQTATQSNHPELAKLRQQLDVLDQDLLTVLAERMKLVTAVGVYKHAHGIPPLDLQRWQAVVKSRVAFGETVGLESSLVREVLETIHQHALRMEKALQS